jgi:pimeloyl-ACP methyl ester carboxylesterase
MKKFARRFLVTLLVLVVLLIGGVWLQGLSRHADAAPEALAAMQSDARVSVESGTYLVLSPARGTPRTGVIFYPGAYVDPRGYAPTWRSVAAAGYRVVIVPMPLDAAFFGIDRARAVQSAYPDIQRWVLAGHSLGGAMAGFHASRHPERLAGVIIWDSYPAGSLRQFPRPVWHIHRATAKREPPESFAKRRDLFPAESRWVPIPGGIHMYFGSFTGGGYQEDWAPTISRDVEQALIVAATLEALRDIEQRAAAAS